MSRRAPLTACDRFFLASHLAHLRRGLPGHHCFGLLDVSGALDHRRLRAALAEVMAANPLTTARIRSSLLTARGYWSYAPNVDGAFKADQIPLFYHDLRGDPASEHTQREILSRACREPHDPFASPQIRLLHLQFRDDTHRLVLRWPHYLMDLQGGWMLLGAIGKAASASQRSARGKAFFPGESATHLPPDDYPAGWSRRYVSRLVQGLRAWARYRRIPAARLRPRSHITDASAELLHRHWPPSALVEIDEALRPTCAPGPLRYTRFFMIALLRALDDLHEDLGLRGESYILPLPMLRPRRRPRTAITCNDLTIAMLVVDRRLVSRTADLDATLTSQIDAYCRTGLDEATWLATTLAGWLRMRQYRWLIAHEALPPCSAGFASFRANGEWDHFLGAHVENFSACPLPTIPPGLTTSFCRFGDRLNLSIGFYPHLCPTPLAHRLTDRIEHHLGVSASTRNT